MSKQRVTKKLMREIYGNKIIDVPYCELQTLLSFESPSSYSTRSEGWACDYYEFDDFCISTGYASIGRKLFSYDDLRVWELAARDIFDREWEWEKRKKLIDNLLSDFIGTVHGRLNSHRKRG